MSLKNRFLIYLAILHLAIALLVGPLLIENRLWLLVVELLFVVSIIAGFRLVRGLFANLDLLGEGARFLDEQEFTTRFVETGRPELDRLVSIYNRLADDLRNERTKLREQHHFLSQVIEASPSGIVILDFEGRVDLVNPAAQRMLAGAGSGTSLSTQGRLDPEAIRGSRPREIGSALGPDLALALTEGPRVHTTGDGGKIRLMAGRFSDRGHDRRFLLLDEMTAEVKAAEKTAYERLIRMIAHEVGNSVAASGSLLQSSLSYARHLPSEDRGDFEEAVGVCLGRLATLNGFVRDLAEVVRLPPPRLQPCDLEAALRGNSLLLRASAKKAGIGFVVEIEERLPAVLADRAQIEQAFLNIAKNAIEAAGDKGFVSVRARAKDGAIQVEVENSSPGIEEDVQASLFTPFFSTKADGRGLGLTLVREILVHHQAPFALVSPKGGPTRFTFSLKRA